MGPHRSTYGVDRPTVHTVSRPTHTSVPSIDLLLSYIQLSYQYFIHVIDLLIHTCSWPTDNLYMQSTYLPILTIDLFWSHTSNRPTQTSNLVFLDLSLFERTLPWTHPLPWAHASLSARFRGANFIFLLSKKVAWILKFLIILIFWHISPSSLLWAHASFRARFLERTLYWLPTSYIPSLDTIALKTEKQLFFLTVA